MPCISMGSETPVLPVKALSIKLDGITPFISPMLSESQLVKKEMGDHGKTPSYRWRNEGILPGFQATGMSRRLEVHDHTKIQLQYFNTAPAPAPNYRHWADCTWL